MKKYFVIAERYDCDKKECTRRVVGEFYSFARAKIFKDVYNKNHEANAYIAGQIKLN